MNKFLKGIFITAISTSVMAQTDSTTSDETIFDFSLEQLMNMEIEVAGAHKRSIRETAGIVSVLTQKDIENSGARDLIDLLRTVPGFDFAGDIENTISLGVRGNYAMEGKVLLMVDGLEINETGYGTAVLGNRFLTENIQKIEIIRGPGSAIYGGMAELAVINIVTKKGADLNGGYANVTYGNSNGKTSRMSTEFAYGQETESGLTYSLSGYYSEANRSNETIDYATSYLDDENGASATNNFADSSLTKTLNLNLNLKYKDLTVQGLMENHDIQYNYTSADWLIFGGYYLGARYDLKIGENLTLTPSISHKKVKPWTYKGNISGDTPWYLIDNYRTKEAVNGLYEMNENIALSFGVEATQDKGVRPDDSLTFINDEPIIQYSNLASYAELSVETDIANITVGARYDNHSQFGGAFVPRIAITRAFDKLHLKGLLSRAFRAPVINNFDLNQDIKPEFTTVAEFEIGYLINENMAINANAFWTSIKDPIIYFYDGETYEEAYLNGDLASTVGFELDYRINYDWGYVNTNYSLYQNNGTEAEPYLDETNAARLNGFSNHKIAVSSGISINNKIKISPQVVYNSAKNQYMYLSEWWEDYGAYNIDPTLIANIAVNYKPIEKLRLSLGAYDLFSANYIAASAYDSGWSGTPFMGREFTFSARYSF